MVLKAPRSNSRHPLLKNHYKVKGKEYEREKKELQREAFMYDHFSDAKATPQFFGMQYESLLLQYAEHGSLDKTIEFAKHRALFGDDSVKLRYMKSILGTLRSIAQKMLSLNEYGLYCHGDLRPANILLDRNYRPMIADLTGVQFNDKALQAVAGIVPLSYHPRYSSPELLVERRISDRADVNSMGMMLVDAFGKHKVVDEQSYARRRDIKDIIVMPSALGYSNVDPQRSLDKLIFNATRFDPKQRWSMKQLYDALVDHTI